MTWSFYLGIALLAWVVWDVFSGSAWLHREYHRASEPVSYWLIIIVWALVAVSCFYW